MTTEFTALHSTDSATTEVVESGALVGNPRRTRHLDIAVIDAA
ncbi:MAG TPA: hypothetical protein VES60_04095 [Nakamurella sp.]|nr:hypothetical protein [Nakamurella sp.]